MKPIVIAESVSKKYSRNAPSHLSYGIRDLLSELFGRRGNTNLRADEFLAVNDVSFHLNEGDSLALIGRNGSGKTTLLKMLNGLVKPDGGTIMLEGRVQALINLGAGFNPALSGSDNIYNSASLMGLSSREIAAIVDEVTDFAELEEFISTPVGAYSSGMKARLGFSVAIHLRPDILLIDEILAVGDYAFQNKCFVKMHELKKQGVTIILVSHSHTHVVQLCERALWLDKGRMKQWGPADETVKAYLNFLDDAEQTRVAQLNRLREENVEAMEAKSKLEDSLFAPIYDECDRISDVSVKLVVNGKEAAGCRVHDAIEIEYSFRLLQYVTDLNVSIVINGADGRKYSAISTLNGNLLKHVHEGAVCCRVRIPDLNLNPGRYVIVMPVHEGKSYLWRNVVKEFVVSSGEKLTWEIMDFRYEYEVAAEGKPPVTTPFL